LRTLTFRLQHMSALKKRMLIIYCRSAESIDLRASRYDFGLRVHARTTRSSARPVDFSGSPPFQSRKVTLVLWELRTHFATFRPRNWFANNGPRYSP
jgi:hypothetical protein